MTLLSLALHLFPARFARGRPVLLLPLLLAALQLGAAEPARKTYDLPAGEAVATLRAFAEQSGEQVVYMVENVRGERTRAVAGTFTAREALDRMLADTKLAASQDEATGALVVGRREPARPPREEARPKMTPEPAQPPDGVLKLESFVVTGSNIRRTDYETVQPVTRLSTDLGTGGVATPLDLMRRVPVLGALSAYENQDGGRVRGSASSINMRGLGGQNTLILFNGRRLPNYSLALGGLVFVNINNLPLAAVDRVEILRDGASAIYGADATAGVVNFITKRNADERRLNLRFGDTTDGAAPEYRATFTYGRRFSDNNGGLLVVVDAFSRQKLMARDRAFAVRGDSRGLVPEPFGSAANWNFLTNIGPYASFTVVAQSGAPNTLPGFASNSAYVDFDGTLRSGTRSPANYYNDADYFSLVPSRESRDIYLSLDRKLGRRLEFFTELSYNDVVSEVAQSPMTIASTQNIDATGSPMVIPATNYYNPFGTRFYGPGTANPGIAPRAVQFNYLEPGFGPRLGRISTNQSRLVAGLRGGFGATWTWETGALQARNEARDLTRNLIRRSALVAALARSTPDAFNMFGGPNANAEPVLAGIRIDSYLGGTSTLRLWDAKAAGELWTLPAGPLQLAMGVEYRDEALRSDYPDVYRDGDLLNTAVQTGFVADRDVRSAYAEFAVPLAHDDDRRFFRRAELQLAGRWENFSGFGSAAKPRAGISGVVLPGLFVRASVGAGFRAPTLTQLYGGIASSMAARVDSFRPQDGNIRRTILQPPNPALQPEETKSHTVGVVWEPAFLRGFSVEIDWWSYRLKDQINVISRDTELALEVAGGAYSNPYVVRVAPTSAVPVGPILSITEPLMNFSLAETSGYDFNVTYRHGRKESGLLTLGADATYIDEYAVQLDATQAAVSFPADSSRPRFKGTGRVEWERRAWAARVSCQYTSSYLPADRVTVSGQNYEMPAYTTWDGSVSHTFGRKGPFKGITATVGVNNLLNDAPPAYPVRQGYDARLFSPQGRFAYLNVGINF